MEDEEIKSDEVLEQTNETENTDTQTVEENVVVEEKKTFKQMLEENPEYQEELNNIVKGRLSRAEERVRREYEEKYSPLNSTLNTALGTSTPEEATTKLREFYKEQGVNIPEAPKFSDKDTKLLAHAEAQEIISSGYEDIVDELNRLTDKGVDKMNMREKLMYQELATEEKKIRDVKELNSIGVNQEKLNNKEFIDFAKNFEGSKFSTKQVYEMFTKLNPKEEAEPIGSMKDTTTKSKYKDFYTPEEVRKFTYEDLDDPELMKRVENSMMKWGK